MPLPLGKNDALAVVHRFSKKFLEVDLSRGWHCTISWRSYLTVTWVYDLPDSHFQTCFTKRNWASWRRSICLRSVHVILESRSIWFQVTSLECLIDMCASHCNLSLFSLTPCLYLLFGEVLQQIASKRGRGEYNQSLVVKTLPCLPPIRRFCCLSPFDICPVCRDRQHHPPQGTPRLNYPSPSPWPASPLSYLATKALYHSHQHHPPCLPHMSYWHQASCQ